MIDSSYVLYEDNHLLAVNKPAGLLSQPTEIENDSLETRVKAWIKKKDQKPGNVFIGVVHRLDKPASGVVIFAKTSKALTRLNEALRLKEMHKTYYALVEGVVQRKEDTLIHFLKHDDHRSYVSKKDDNLAKSAVLHYEMLQDFGTACLLTITLETGRYHQIRCQLAAIGHPIIGDRRYGAKRGDSLLPLLPQDAVALHHVRLTLAHPITKVNLSIEAPLPVYFL